MRYLGIVIALVFAIAGGYGVFAAHDNGGWPIAIIGVALLVYLLTRPTAPSP